jgi:hypothetical protein
VDEQIAVSSALAQFGSLIERLQRDPALGPCADALLLRASSALSTAPAVPERPWDESFALVALIAVASREALLSAVSQWTGDAPSPWVWLNALVRGTELDRDARDAVLRAIDLHEVRFESRWSAVVLRRLRGATASLDDEPLPFDEMSEDHVRQCARMGLEGELLSAMAREPRAIRVRLLPSLWRTIDAQTRERFAPMLIETAREEFDDNPWTCMLLSLAPWLPTELLARFKPAWMPDRRVVELLAGADGVRRVRAELVRVLLESARSDFDPARCNAT